MRADSSQLPSAEALVRVVSGDQWDNEVTALALPRGLQLMLGDVSQGSNTPGIVLTIFWNNSGWPATI